MRHRKPPAPSALSVVLHLSPGLFRDSLCLGLNRRGIRISNATSNHPTHVHIRHAHPPDLDALPCQTCKTLWIPPGPLPRPLSLARQKGVLGVVQSSASLNELLRVLRKVSTGHFAACKESQRLEASPDPAEALSPREKAILAKILRGERNQEIAYDCDIKPQTVSEINRRILVKLHCKSQAELFRWAAERGWRL